ncbi:hypothetical protein J3F83DRAFT_764105 [Trichoderma novae-zelandiae]
MADAESGAASLFESIARADLVGLKEVLTLKQLDVETRDPAGRTALQLAVLAGTAGICQLLIDHGAKLDTWTGQGEAVLHLAARRGDVDVLRAVMDAVESNQRASGHENRPDGRSGIGDKADLTVHVDSLTHRFKMSPLYIAVALVAEVLLTRYHADPNIVIGHADIHRGTRTVHVLEAALQHPRDVCRSLLRLLLQHGARLLDTSSHTVTESLFFMIMKRHEDALDIFAELDAENLRSAITKGVINLGLEDTAFKLLSYGAPPHLDFKAPLEIQADASPFRKKDLETAEGDFWQPILSAALYEMPRLVMELLHRGVDPNTRLTEQQARYMINHRRCRTVLDVVKSKLVELRSWNIDDESVCYEIKGTPEEAEQRSGKQNAVAQLIKAYEEAEAKLVSLGAQISDGLSLEDPLAPVSQQSFKRIQLHPPPTETNAQLLQPSKDIDPMKLNTVEDGRQALLAGCQDGNIALVKALTLRSWGPDLKSPPIAISDVSGYTQRPFFVAIENKHYDLARTIVQIATVQHVDFADNDSSDLCNKLADDEHSADSIRSLSAQIKSTVTAKKMVADSHSCFAGEKQKDMDMLKFALEMESSFPREQSDIEHQTRHAWALVEHGDWPEGFEEYIEATGAPFRHVVSQDRVMAAYKNFADNNDFSNRKAGPEASRAEFVDAVEKWMNKRKNLVLHCAILSRNINLVKFLLSAHPELLEVQSIDGWTPLLTAALHQRIEVLHILLEAGASPSATDLFGRNMLHLLLVSPGQGYIQEPEKLSSFLQSMDRSMLHQLLEQRCDEIPGGLTPLARWVSTRPAPNGLFSTLLDVSNSSALELLDGRGHTLLHTVTCSSMEDLVRPVIEKAPHAMFHEDIEGKTPLDHAVEKQLYGFIEHVMSSYTRNRKWQASSPLTHWPLFAFASDYAGLRQPRDPYQAWEISRELAESVKSRQFPRKLVTKVEREEVAILSKNKKIQKNPKGDQHDVVSLSVYKPGNLCCGASVPGGLFIAESASVAKHHGGMPHTSAIWGEEHVKGWKPIVDAVHEKGGVPLAAEQDGFTIKGPSAMPFEGGATPEEMTTEDIESTIEDYDVSNSRTDEYGGSIENRNRLVVDIVQAVSDAIGAARLGIKLSPWSDFQGMRMDNPIPQFTDLVKRINNSGIGYLNLIESQKVDWAWAVWDKAIIATGGYLPETALELVERNPDRDIVVAFGRRYVSNPDLPFRIQRGLELNPYDRSIFYKVGAPEGLIDYPFSKECLALKN